MMETKNEINLTESKNKKSLNFLIKIQKLSKGFGSIKVFENFNLTIFPGDRIALLGVNGSGKSTLIDMILGLQPKDKGEILYADGFVNFLRSSQVTFQVGEYPSHMKVKHLVNFYCTFYAQVYPKKMVQRLIEILEIKKFWEQKANDLSYGQRKKIQALLMFIVDSNFYITDELTAGVDINTRVKIIALFQKLFKAKKNKSMIWITHDSREIEKLCNRVVIISKTNLKVVFDGSIEEVKTKYKNIDNMVASHLKEEVTEEIDAGDIEIDF